jgi:long-subunit acyl-CoA synthetase (AMP-forming)
LSSCGKPAPYSHLAIMDDGGKLLPTGEVGEIVVQSPMVMQGYYKNPELTAEVSATAGITPAMWATGMRRISITSLTARRT